MKTSCLMLSTILCLGAQASWAQDVCQQALANINQLEQQARQPGMPASDVARYNEAAQNYRNFYNQNCLGGGPASSDSGYSGGSGGNNKLDAMQQIFDGLAGMAAIMEQKRQREEAEARQQRLKWELERMEQEREDAERAAEARRKAAAAKAEDDRKRQSIDNPFETQRATSESDNPFETQSAAPASGNPFDAPVPTNRAITLGPAGTTVPSLRGPEAFRFKVEYCASDHCVYRAPSRYRESLRKACLASGGELQEIGGTGGKEKGCWLWAKDAHRYPIPKPRPIDHNDDGGWSNESPRATSTRPSGISGPSGRGSGAREPSVSAK